MTTPNPAPTSRTVPLLWILLPLLLIPPALAATSQPQPVPTLSLHLHPALQATLFAAEPLVVDPVALAFDAHGRALVVEMRDYPYGIGPSHTPGGTVRILEDTNRDGQADRSTVFADGLSFPTAVAPWRNGLLVAAPPEILFLADTDGDGRADQRETLYRGFTLGVTDSNMNGLRWGLDNRVHGLNGGNGGNIESPRLPGRRWPLGNRDFSFDPDSADFTTTYHASGGFGLVFDTWGRSFVTYNINHIQHRILPAALLDRFPGLPPLEATESISDHGDMARIFPVSPAQTRPNHPEQSGHFSAAGGLGFIGSGFLPGDLEGSLLVCDVVGNLVHRDLLHADGPTFRASRAPGEQAREFAASTNPACRPVGVELGPDGALYLIDMQREVIEHPDYIPEKLRRTLDLRAGADRGRIYRLVPAQGALPAWTAPGTRPTLSLVDLLSHPNQWQRTTAQRLLVERRDPRALSPLKRLLRHSSNPLARLHALWTLAGLQALDVSVLHQSLQDPHAGVRENAVQLAALRLGADPSLAAHLLPLAHDPASRVRFQTALALGNSDHPHTLAALKSILLQDFRHRWSRVAVLASLPHHTHQLLADLLQDAAFWKPALPAALDCARELAEVLPARDGATGVNHTLALLTRCPAPDTARAATLDGLAAGLQRRPLAAAAAADARPSLDQLASTPALLAPAWRVANALQLPPGPAQTAALATAARLSLDPQRPLAARLQDLDLLSLGSFAEVHPTLFTLLERPEPGPLQQAALALLRRFNDPQIPRELLSHWSSLSPTVRPAALNLLLQRVAYHLPLIEAIESGQLTLGELNLDLEQRRRLLRHSSEEVKTRAARFLSDEEYSNRKAVVDVWLPQLPASGDAAHGRDIFERACAQCHRSRDIGQVVGPDLSSLAHRSVEDLLSNILDPNMAINPGYLTYSCETTDGEIETGILAAESSDAITLLQAAGQRIVIPRTRIRSLKSTGVSLMPEGLEAGLSPADLRNLIAYLQSTP